MAPERALERIMKLVALAAPTSRATVEERRTAALAAVNLMSEHGLVPGQHAGPRDDGEELLTLALHAAELEQQLLIERGARAEELRERDRRWRREVDAVRSEERSSAASRARKAKRITINRERVAQARAGGSGSRRTRRARTPQRDRARGSQGEVGEAERQASADPSDGARDTRPII